MFANLLIVTVIIIALWVGAVAYYLYSSRQHGSLEKDVEAVYTLLEKNQRDAG